MTVEWFGKKVEKAIAQALLAESKKAADKIEKDAKTLLKQKVAKTTAGGLLDQFSVEENKYGDGYTVWCQGPGNWRKPYHSSFVELGTYKDEAQPFLRPTMKKHKRPTRAAFKKAIDNL